MRDTTRIFIRSVFEVAGAVLVVITGLLGFVAQFIDPCQCITISYMALVLSFILIIAFIMTIFFSLKRSWLAVVTAFVIIVNFQFVMPLLKTFFYTPDGSGAGKNTFIVASYNVHGFSHTGYEIPVFSMAEYLEKEKVDIVCMQEYFSAPMLNDNETDGAFKLYPYKYIRRKTLFENGLAVFSKYPIIRGEAINFKNSTHGAIMTDIMLPSGPVRLINVHLQTTGYSLTSGKGLSNRIRVMGNNTCLRSEQAKQLRKIADTTTIPLVICGDFNDPPTSYVYKKVRGRLKDCYNEAGSGTGRSMRGIFSFLRIDYIFHSGELNCINSHTDKLDWSDHNPVIGELEYQSRK
jgi:endonuclease/exonuclease/phosphatase family metal-dependent hydrolase